MVVLMRTRVIMTKLAISGAGKLGTALAYIATRSGFDIPIAQSEDPEKIALMISVLAPGAVAMAREEPVADAEVVVVAIPLPASDTLDVMATVGQIVSNTGFDHLPLDSLHEGKKLEPGHLAFGAAVPLSELRNLINRTEV